MVYPNPYNPETAVRGTLKFLYVKPGSAARIYSLSGELVAMKDTYTNCIEWDARTIWEDKASPGVYYYVVEERANSVVARGKLFITNK